MAKKKKSKFSKKVVTTVIILNVIFAVAVLAIFLKTSCEPTSLIVAWFSFTTVEMWNLKDIKNKEEKRNGYDEI